MFFLYITGRGETGSKKGSSSGGTGYPNEGTGKAAERGIQHNYPGKKREKTTPISTKQQAVLINHKCCWSIPSIVWTIEGVLVFCHFSFINSRHGDWRYIYFNKLFYSNVGSLPAGLSTL